MSRDCLIALGTSVDRTHSCPWAMGVFRVDGSSDRDILSDALSAARKRCRSVFVGDIADQEKILFVVEQVRTSVPDARFSIFLHWTQALLDRPNPKLLDELSDVYVAIDKELSRAEIELIRSQWSPRWVLIPRPEMDWSNWISQTLFPDRMGQMDIFAPRQDSPDGPFLDCDELRLQLDNFTLEHPLIQLSPSPAEWHLADELGWENVDRRRSDFAVIARRGQINDGSICAIIPIRLVGKKTEAIWLHSCLDSIVKMLASKPAILREVVVVCDRDPQVNLPNLDQFPLVTVVDLVRTDQHYGDDAVGDWRAGHVRNLGAHFSSARPSDLFLFVDSDMVLENPGPILNLLDRKDWDVAFQRESPKQVAATKTPLGIDFRFASSSLMAVRKCVFDKVGGFSDAYCHYGCEDNHFVWQANRIGGRAIALQGDTAHHLRPVLNTDDIGVKMARMHRSADLFYRSTLDPLVHDHFFSSLGRQTYARAILKKCLSRIIGKILFAPLLFLLTLIESNDRIRYLEGGFVVVLWKIKRPLHWLQGNLWHLRRPVTRSRNFMKLHAWKLPHAMSAIQSKIRHLCKIVWSKILYHQFGWRPIGWRISVLLKTLWSTVSWRPKTWLSRCHGTLLWFAGLFHMASSRMVNAAIRIVWIRPVHAIKANGWKARLYLERIENLLKSILAQRWIFGVGLVRLRGMLIRSWTAVCVFARRTSSKGWIFSVWWIRVLGGLRRWKTAWAVALHRIFAHRWIFSVWLDRILGQFKKIWMILKVLIERIWAQKWRASVSILRLYSELSRLIVLAGVMIKRLWSTRWKLLVQFERLWFKRGLLFQPFRWTGAQVWRIKVFGIRVRGKVIQIWWAFLVLSGRVRSESWIFNEPSAYFELRTPNFYRLVWRHLLKARFFVEYQIKNRLMRSNPSPHDGKTQI